MNKEELEAALQELDTALVQAFPGPESMSVLVVGGASLLLADVSVRPTKDVDIIIVDFFGQGEATLVFEGGKTEKKLRSVIKKLGKKFGLPKDELMWVNDDCASLLVEVSPIPPMKLLRAYQKLHLYIPEDMGFILACKFMAGRPFKDFADINVLCQLLDIRTRIQAQRLIMKYVPSLYHQSLHQVQKTLNTLFPEETGENLNL